MKGSRRPDETPPHTFRIGDYGRWKGEWFGRTPNDLLSALARHEVVEHEDGTITVSPSILCGNRDGGRVWHGFLERGVWRECLG